MLSGQPLKFFCLVQKNRIAKKSDLSFRRNQFGLSCYLLQCLWITKQQI